jgi:protein-histidine pros-kinase
VVCQEVIGEVAANLRQLAEQKGLRFDLAVPPDPIVLHTDRRALSQIIINLTNNAIKFTEHGSVRLALAQQNGHAQKVTRISVADTGVGIRAQDRARLFEAFAQVRPADARPREGTGLGLHLSQRLAELLGGSIECISELGQGSLFTLLIPEH